MHAWWEVQLYITRNKLPFTILRFNMSLAGRLIDTATGEVLAATVKDAARVVSESRGKL